MPRHTQRKNLTHLFKFILDIPLTKESPSLIYASKIKYTRRHSSAVGCNEHCSSSCFQGGVALSNCCPAQPWHALGREQGCARPAHLHQCRACEQRNGPLPTEPRNVPQHIELTTTKGSKGLGNILCSVPVKFGSREHAAGSTQHVTSKEPLKKTSFDSH